MVKVFAIVFIALLVDFFHKRVLRFLYNKTKDSDSLWDDALIQALMGPTSVLIWVFGISFAGDVFHFQYSSLLRQLVVIIVVAWVVVKFINFIEKNIIDSAEKAS